MPRKKSLFDVDLGNLVAVGGGLADAAEAAGAARGDETDFLTGRGDALRRGGVADVLVVTTAEGMLDLL